jgi:hypothetical protein
VAIFTGGTRGLFVWAKVWFVIWPNQQNRNRQCRRNCHRWRRGCGIRRLRGALASRTNTLFSIPHAVLHGRGQPLPPVQRGHHGRVDWIVLLAGAVIVLIGLSALMGSQGTTTKPLDSRTIWSGVVLWIVLVIIIKVTLR